MNGGKMVPLQRGRAPGPMSLERRNRREVEAVEAFHRRKPCLIDAALDPPAFPLDQFEFGQAQQIAGWSTPSAARRPGRRRRARGSSTAEREILDALIECIDHGCPP